MKILIEQTERYQDDIGKLSEDENRIISSKVNDCANLFPNYELQTIALLSGLNGYDSSLYVLKVSQKLAVVLTVDEDPIFGQTIITLFRVVGSDDLDKAYQDVAESLYQEFLH